MKRIILTLISILIYQFTFAQNNTGIGTTNPNPNALLELQNNGNPLGLLLPRQDISTFTLGPSDAGMMVFNTVDNKVYTWNGTGWVSSTSEWGVNGTNIYNLNSGNVGIGTQTPTGALEVITTNQTAIVAETDGLAAGQFAISAINTGNNDVAGYFYASNTAGGPNHHGIYTASEGAGSGIYAASSGLGSGSAAIFNNFNSANTSAVVKIFNDGTGPSLTAVGAVGIGTEVPVEKLHVFDTANPTIRLVSSASTTLSNGVNSGKVEFLETNSTVGSNAYGGGITYDGLNNLLKLQMYNGVTIYEAISIQRANGYVGIGTTLPSRNLHVEGNGLLTGRLELTGTTDASGTAGTGVLEIASALRMDGNEIITNSNAPLYLQNDNAGDLIVDGGTFVVDASTNRVGIGTTTPVYALDIQGTGRVFAVDNASNFVAANSSGTYDIYLWPRWTDDIMYLNYGSSGFNIRNNSSVSTMFMTNNNYVGVNTSSPATTLHVNHPSGTSNGLSVSNDFDGDRWHFYTWTTDELALFFNGATRGEFNGTSGVYTALSDRRFKEDIQDLPGILDKVKQLKPVEYKFKSQEDPDERFIGFIAQDVEPLFPNLVSHTQSDNPEEQNGEISDPYTLDYSGFSVVAIKAIQELIEENEELKERIEALEDAQ